MDTKNKNNSSNIKEHSDKLKKHKDKIISKVSSFKENNINIKDTNLASLKENIKNKLNIKTKSAPEPTFVLDFGSNINANTSNTKAKEDDNTENTEKKKLSINFSIPEVNLKNNKIVIISTIILFNIITSFVSFNISSTIKFNHVNEQFMETISRSIKSPQTDIALKSKFDSKTDSIVFYYEVNDKLDSYTYKIKNVDVDETLRVKLLESIASKTKEVKSLASINTTSYNSITLVDDYYIINNKYRINEENLSGKDIKTITESIKSNNINEFNTNKTEFIISLFLTLGILEGFAFYNIRKIKNKKDVN